MAVDMFLELKDVKGESRDSVYKEKIDILAWSWGASNSGTSHSGGGSGAGKANFQDISITKYVDSSSAPLLQFVTQGKHIETGKLVVRKAGENPLEYIVIELGQILITSVQTGGSGGEERLTENITLNFADYKYIYTPQQADGSGDTAVDWAWNIAENKKM